MRLERNSPAAPMDTGDAEAGPSRLSSPRSGSAQKPWAVIWYGGLSAWRRRGLLLVAGMISILAMAPFFISPVLFLTLPLMVLAIDATVAEPMSAAGRRPFIKAFGVGWWFGFGYHLAGLFWIGEAFLVDAETFAALMPFAVTAMPAGLALFFGAATSAAAALWRPGLARVLSLAIALAAAEWLRGHVLTGFPWNILGYALTFPLALMQWASVIGIYGLTLVAVVIFSWPGARLIDAPGSPGPSGVLRLGVTAVLPLAGLLGTGGILLVVQAPASDRAETVRIVQPSVPQREKWLPENQERIFNQHIALSLRTADGREDGGTGKSLILWPEAAMPFLPLNSPVALSMIGDMLPAGTVLASGALRAEPATAPGQRRRVFNSLLLFGSGGSLVASYDKIHLVPFGEYLPLQPWLEAIGLRQLSQMRGGFGAGPTPRPIINTPGLPPLGPLICYEAIFPGAVIQTRERPAILINVTNDGWFGNTTGPRQHLHQARVRAAEEGTPLLRAANNGISAVIDAQGRLRSSLGMNVAGVIDDRLPGLGVRTIYSRLGDLPFFLLLFASVGVMQFLGRRPHGEQAI